MTPLVRFNIAIQLLATQQKLDEVKDVMVASVELVLERGERLELLVDKADNLQQQVMRPANIFYFVEFFLSWVLLVTFLPWYTGFRHILNLETPPIQHPYQYRPRQIVAFDVCCCEIRRPFSRGESRRSLGG